jgi:hypothetical protein
MSLNRFNPLINELNTEDIQNTNFNEGENNPKLISLSEEKEKYNLIDENKKKIISFYSKFKYLCCKYKIDNIRKNHIDIIIKKVKIKLFKDIHEALKFCLNININRLPQNFIVNVKIEYNQIYLRKTINEIYSEFSVLPSLKEIIENKVVKKDKTEIFILLMNTTLLNIIKIYLISNLFIYDKKKLEKKSGLNDAILFDFVANNLSDYFQYGNSFTYKKNLSKNIINN